jgi:hypothetical protein
MPVLLAESARPNVASLVLLAALLFTQTLAG